MLFKLVITIVLFDLIRYLFKTLNKNIYIHYFQIKIPGFSLKVITKAKDELPSKDAHPDKDIK